MVSYTDKKKSMTVIWIVHVEMSYKNDRLKIFKMSDFKYQEDLRKQIDNAFNRIHISLLPVCSEPRPNDISSRPLSVILEALMTLLNKPKDQIKEVLRDFENNLQQFDVENISKATLEKMQKFINMPDLNPEIAQKSTRTGAAIAEWIHAVVQFARLYQNIHPSQEENT